MLSLFVSPQPSHFSVTKIQFVLVNNCSCSVMRPASGAPARCQDINKCNFKQFLYLKSQLFL